MDTGLIVFLSIVAVNVICFPLAIRWLDKAFKYSRPTWYDMRYKSDEIGSGGDKFLLLMPVCLAAVCGAVPLVLLFAICAYAVKHGKVDGIADRVYGFLFPSNKEYQDQVAAKEKAEQQVEDLWKMLNKTPKKSTDYDIIKTAYDAAVEEHKKAEAAASLYYSKY